MIRERELAFQYYLVKDFFLFPGIDNFVNLYDFLTTDWMTDDLNHKDNYLIYKKN